MKIIPLGTAGFIPTNGKESASYLVIRNDTAILLDAGTGVKRLFEPQIKDLLKGINDLHVIFSHLHHDHTAGVTWLLRLWSGRLYFYLPSTPLVQFDGIEAIKKLTTAPFFALNIDEWPNLGEIYTIVADYIDINGTIVHIIPQKHSGGSIGVRIGNFSYITDTEARDEIKNFIINSELLFIDTMHDKEDYDKMNITEYKRAQHGYSLGNANLALISDVKRMGLIHIDPLYDNERINNLLNESQSIFDNSFIPKEVNIYEII